MSSASIAAATPSTSPSSPPAGSTAIISDDIIALLTQQHAESLAENQMAVAQANAFVSGLVERIDIPLIYHAFRMFAAENDENTSWHLSALAETQLSDRAINSEKLSHLFRSSCSSGQFLIDVDRLVGCTANRPLNWNHVRTIANGFLMTGFVSAEKSLVVVSNYVVAKPDNAYSCNVVSPEMAEQERTGKEKKLFFLLLSGHHRLAAAMIANIVRAAENLPPIQLPCLVLHPSKLACLCA